MSLDVTYPMALSLVAQRLLELSMEDPSPPLDTPEAGGLKTRSLWLVEKGFPSGFNSPNRQSKPLGAT